MHERTSRPRLFIASKNFAVRVWRHAFIIENAARVVVANERTVLVDIVSGGAYVLREDRELAEIASVFGDVGRCQYAAVNVDRS